MTTIVDLQVGEMWPRGTKDEPVALVAQWGSASHDLEEGATFLIQSPAAQAEEETALAKASAWADANGAIAVFILRERLPHPRPRGTVADQVVYLPRQGIES